MIRPKHVDTDKPEGYIKRKLRRWFRRFVKAETRTEALGEWVTCPICEGGGCGFCFGAGDVPSDFQERLR